jgi:hypothetical protein
MEDTNEISRIEKIIAGLLLIFLTILPVRFIVAYWPDQMPGPKDDIKPLYSNTPYHIQLVGIPDSMHLFDSILVREIYKDTLQIKKIDSGVVKEDRDSILENKIPPTDTIQKLHAISLKYSKPDNGLIHLNIIVLILVASGGFLGNMIHIASSFTTFIGAGQFKRSWLLWYCVKPFTAAALALALYFVFRGGFLNYAADATGINLYGMLTIAILAGLFTDRATLKLGEVFDVIFSLKKDAKSDDNRPDKLLPPNPKITAINASALEKEKANSIVINGENLDKEKLLATINDETVAITAITPTSATIQYSIPDSQKDKTVFIVTIKDKDGNTIGTQSLTLKKNDAAESPQDSLQDNEADNGEDLDDDNENDRPNETIIKG